jgi:hypothetical protein
MAGDWIKMRINLDSDPRVIEIASELKIPELHVVGCLWKVWAWADSHTLDGNAIRVTDVTLDRFTCVTGFCDALRKVGWLEGRGNSLSFPRFAEHNGQTAKKRAETKVRVTKHRNAKCVTDVTQKVLPEKRREEKSNKKENTGDLAQSDYLTDPAFSEAFEQFKASSRSNHNWTIAESTAQVWLFELSRHSIEDAIEILRFSTGAGTKKPVMNGDHKAKPAGDGRSSGGVRRKVPSFEEGLL